MRTTKLYLALALVAAVGVAAVPASAGAKASSSPTATGSAISDFEKKQNRRIKKARRKADRAHARIDSLKEFADSLAADNTAQDDSLTAVKATVDAIVAGVPDIVGGLEALEAGLLAVQAVLEKDVGPGLTALKDALEKDVGPALEAIDAALNDTTTGLVGLNNARPQFGVFSDDGDWLGGTGEVASGPNADALQGGGFAGLYVIDFNNDVSSRMYSVNVFPGGPATTVPVASAVNCSVAGALCAAAIGAAGTDTDPDRVVVQIGSGFTSATNGFSVTAFSG